MRKGVLAVVAASTLVTMTATSAASATTPSAGVVTSSDVTAAANAVESARSNVLQAQDVLSAAQEAHSRALEGQDAVLKALAVAEAVFAQANERFLTAKRASDSANEEVRQLDLASTSALASQAEARLALQVANEQKDAAATSLVSAQAAVEQADRQVEELAGHVQAAQALLASAQDDLVAASAAVTDARKALDKARNNEADVAARQAKAAEDVSAGGQKLADLQAADLKAQQDLRSASGTQTDAEIKANTAQRALVAAQEALAPYDEALNKAQASYDKAIALLASIDQQTAAAAKAQAEFDSAKAEEAKAEEALKSAGPAPVLDPAIQAALDTARSEAAAAMLDAAKNAEAYQAAERELNNLSTTQQAQQEALDAVTKQMNDSANQEKAAKDELAAAQVALEQAKTANAQAEAELTAATESGQSLRIRAALRAVRETSDNVTAATSRLVDAQRAYDSTQPDYAQLYEMQRQREDALRAIMAQVNDFQTNQEYLAKLQQAKDERVLAAQQAEKIKAATAAVSQANFETQMAAYQPLLASFSQASTIAVKATFGLQSSNDVLAKSKAKASGISLKVERLNLELAQADQAPYARKVAAAQAALGTANSELAVAFSNHQDAKVASRHATLDLMRAQQVLDAAKTALASGSADTGAAQAASQEALNALRDAQGKQGSADAVVQSAIMTLSTATSEKSLADTTATLRYQEAAAAKWNVTFTETGAVTALSAYQDATSKALALTSMLGAAKSTAVSAALEEQAAHKNYNDAVAPWELAKQGVAVAENATRKAATRLDVAKSSYQSAQSALTASQSGYSYVASQLARTGEVNLYATHLVTAARRGNVTVEGDIVNVGTGQMIQLQQVKYLKGRPYWKIVKSSATRQGHVKITTKAPAAKGTHQYRIWNTTTKSSVNVTVEVR